MEGSNRVLGAITSTIYTDAFPATPFHFSQPPPPFCQPCAVRLPSGALVLALSAVRHRCPAPFALGPGPIRVLLAHGGPQAEDQPLLNLGRRREKTGRCVPSVRPRPPRRVHRAPKVRLVSGGVPSMTRSVRKGPAEASGTNLGPSPRYQPPSSPLSRGAHSPSENRPLDRRRPAGRRPAPFAPLRRR